MIYGISAKKQCGKDLFLKIWNALILTKDGEPLTDEEIANLKEDLLVRGAEYCGTGTYEKRFFASSLKGICAVLFGCSPSDFESEEFKESLIPEKFRPNMLGANTYREALQKIGTELFRNKFHNDVWVLSSTSGYDSEKCKWFFTDVRFPNEKRIIEDLGGKVIRIEKEGQDDTDCHSSEKALDDYHFDIVVKNNFVFEDYVRQIYDIMIAEGIFDYNRTLDDRLPF